MWLEVAEKWVRRAGAAGALIFTWVAVSGQRSGAKRLKGRSAGRDTAFVRIYQRGSPLFYLVSGVLSIGLLRLIWRPLPFARTRRSRVASLVVGALLYSSGLGLFLWGRATMGDMYNISSSLNAQLYADQKLITRGPFSLVRHPLYLGGQMAGLGALLMYRTWSVLLMAVCMLSFGLRARREEDALAAEFGSEWANYRGRVPAGIWLLGRSSRVGGPFSAERS